MLIFVNEHSEKHKSPIIVIEGGIFIFVGDEHPLNDESPIDFTDDGIVISTGLTNWLQSKRWIDVTVVEIIKCLNNRQLENDLYTFWLIIYKKKCIGHFFLIKVLISILMK